MEFQELVFDDLDRLWLFSNVLSKPTPTTQFEKPITYHGLTNVKERVISWLEDSVDAAIAAIEEEEYEEELEKEQAALEEEFAKRLANAEQSTVTAMLMSAPLRSIKPIGDRAKNRRTRSTRKVMSLKNELFERKRSVLSEIQCGYSPHSMHYT